MKKILILILALIIPLEVNAYEIDFSWNIGFGGNDTDNLTDVIQVDDTHFAVFGETYSTDIAGINNQGYCDAFIILYDITGEVLWQKTLSTSKRDFFTSVIVDDDKNIVVVGLSYGSAGDAYIFKYDLKGNLIWSDQWGGEDYDRFNHIFLQSDGYLVFGSTESVNVEGLNPSSSSRVGRDSVILKYDFNGNIVWQKRYSANGLYSDIKSMYVNQNGEMTLCYNINLDLFLIKLDKNGDEIWSTNLDGINVDLTPDKRLYLDNNNDIYFVGGTRIDEDGNYLPNRSQDGILMKFNSNGELIFTKRFGGSKDEQFEKILLTPDNNFLILGTSDSNDIEGHPNKGDCDVIITKYTKDGELLWNQSYGTDLTDTALYVSFVKDDGFLFIPKSVYVDDGEFHQINEDAIVQKYDKNGRLQWMQTYGGSDVDYFSAALLTKDDKLMVLCNTLSNDIKGIPNKGGYDGIFVKYDISYEMNLLQTKNGTVSFRKNNNLGLIESIPNKGFRVDSVIVKDTLGNQLEVNKIDDQTFSVDLYDDVTVEVAFKKVISNPNTGISSFIILILTLIIVFVSGFFVMKKYNKSY